MSQNNVTPWYLLIVSVKSVEVPIELSDDCYCNVSVPILNGQTLHRASQEPYKVRGLSDMAFEGIFYIGLAKSLIK